MNLRRGFRRITFILAVVSAVFCTFCAVVIVVEKHDSVQSSLQLRLGLDEKGFAALKEAGFSNREIKDYKEEIIELQKGFWVNLSKPELVGLCIVAGLGGGAIGYLGTWLVIWFGGLAIYKLIRWIVLGFRDDVG